MSYAGVGAVLLAFAGSVAGIALLSRAAARLPHDTPNTRSLHVRAVPRAGGYAIWLGFVPAALWLAPAVPGGTLAAWLPAWLLIAIVSARDDVREVPVGARLAAHYAAALWCAASIWIGGHAEAAIGSMATLGTIALLALAIAWASNLYNFMDGSDGLAATMTLIGFSAYGVAAVRTGAPAAAYFALVAATVPFLVVNRPRATMFLGDVGAVPLGFLAATFGISGVISGQWPAWFPALVFLPFIADATTTLARRIARGQPVAAAHKDHYYQRLHQLGAGHAGTLTAYMLASAGTSAAALGCLVFAPGWGIVALGVACVVCFILFGAIDRRWRRKLPASR